ncbi:cytochrome c oxidase subunit 3 [Neptunicella sp. SCSIO 80796]|uniref:cytochrome c oxidase subunit 3 n=1 Tax=Neptunicella plasticusilytica TaxID=3117012 RepID=UPI003A4D441E
MTSQTSHPGLNMGEKHAGVEERAEIVMFGFWVFLMSDVIIFAMCFGVYATATHALAGGPGPQELFDVNSIIWQTAALLLSSLTCGLASLRLKHAHSDSQSQSRWKLILWIGLTLLLGIMFLGLEMRDFIHMSEQDAVPSRSGWLSAYWALVGLHGLHLVIGVLWGIIVIAHIVHFNLTDMTKMRFMRWSLYWHFLDIIWVAIFSMVFLGGLL